MPNSVLARLCFVLFLVLSILSLMKSFPQMNFLMLSISLQEVLIERFIKIWTSMVVGEDPYSSVKEETRVVKLNFYTVYDNL